MYYNLHSSPLVSKESRMRLTSTVLLAVMSALFIIAVGNITLTFADNAATPWFLSLLFITILMLGLDKAKEEDNVLLPFAVVSALLSFGNEVTTIAGAGVILLAFAFPNLIKAMKNRRVSGRFIPRVCLAWCAAAAVCVLAPYGFMRLSSLMLS